MNDHTTTVSASVIEKIRQAVGPQGVLTAAADLDPYVVDWRGVYRGTTAAVVRPANTAEVAAVMKICAETCTPVVPQGGNTGMCGASIPSAGGGEIVLALARMNRVLEVDPLNNTLTAEAGCVLAAIQQAAADADRLFPLSLGAEGSCQIGGNLSTNAGGINVLRYGNTRDLVLGLEVVLPDGRIWKGLRGLRKDNTGYDLKHLFIGAEGTLGIITAATLKLFPRPAANATAWMAVRDPEAALQLLALMRRHCNDRITAFELISRHSLELVWQHIPGTRDPIGEPHPWYVLTELADAGDESALRADLERALETALNKELVVDAVIAENHTQAQALWHLRESIPEGVRQAPAMVYRHDIAVAVGRIPEFIREAQAALEARFPDVQLICFGHLGDGNLHYNAYLPDRLRSDAAARDAHDVTETVYDIVQQYGGSFSAEHGIGLSKVAELARYKSPVELDLMRTVKHALDPQGLLNPGKVL
ncbi:MAG: FAD-binding oxidoreductase [Polaromonas sp.]|uniref:FAD-binding oxidoreductase n=1 Tax=Polaromonas sp. TaxID=1869339 RepID=UPI002487156F|nr:FAD-binding oxidoreductase [Polaromonas sp.]MDI1269251.1 FAD-binding oxidoreductase [Polaromonas sp.]